MAFKGPPPSRHPRAGIPATSRTRPSSSSSAVRPCSAISMRIDSLAPHCAACWDRRYKRSGQRQDHHPRVQRSPCDDSDPTITLFAPESMSARTTWHPTRPCVLGIRSCIHLPLDDPTSCASRRCMRCGHPQKRSTRRSTGSATAGSVFTTNAAEAEAHDVLSGLRASAAAG
jgi:hypothetical protein